MKYFVTRVLLRPLDDEPLPDFVPLSVKLDDNFIEIGRIPTRCRDGRGWIIALVFGKPLVVNAGEQCFIKIDDPYLVERFGIVIEGGP